jgi:hypothetical protein
MNAAVPNAKQTLPLGTWLTIRHLPKGTTAESLSADLYQQSGLNIPPNLISVRQYDFNAAAIFSVTEDLLTEILNWILEPVKLDGEAVSVVRSSTSRPRRPR